MTRIADRIDTSVAEAMARLAATSEGGVVLVDDGSRMGQCEGCHDDIVLTGPPVPGAMPMCKECAKAMAQGSTVTVIRRPQVARHQPRVKATPEEQASAESKAIPRPGPASHAAAVRRDARHRPVHSVNVGALTDAELGRMVRSGLLTLVVDGAPASKAAADMTSDEALAEARRVLSEERSQRTVLASFKVGTHTVPALDLTDVVLDTVANFKARSPYNKARFRLSEEPLDRETTTWRVLASEHVRLAAAAATKEVLAVGAHAAQQYQGTIAALAGDEPEFSTSKMTKKAKIEALHITLGVTKAEAKRMVEGMA